jgi:hypothetical protein
MTPEVERYNAIIGMDNVSSSGNVVLYSDHSRIVGEMEAKIAHLDLVSGHCECVAVLEAENAALEAKRDRLRELLERIVAEVGEETKKGYIQPRISMELFDAIRKEITP